MAYNKAVELLREKEYPMLKGGVYLDHGGTTIYAKSLIDRFSESMVSNLYGNPHSASSPATLSGAVVDMVRENALRFLGADPEHFDLIFTSNATAAIKLVCESFEDLAAESSSSGHFWYGYHKDAHTSLVGIREHSQHHCFVSDEEVDDWLSGLRSPKGRPNHDQTPGLFAFPGQSNMTGRRLPLSWTRKLRESSLKSHNSTYSLLDAAALVSTAQLDLSDPDSAPDFTALSFYKIFGFPDLGALVVRKDSAHILLWRKYFGGGTVSSLTVFHEATHHRKDATIHDGLEDGTLPFHSIVALGIAIDVHKDLYGSMANISKHTMFLCNRLYLGLSSLSHSNGIRLCEIYYDPSSTQPYTDPSTQGATIAFNVLRADGSYVPYSTVERQADKKSIYVRAGGLCNPGGIASYLKVEPWQFKRAWSAGHRCSGGTNHEIISEKPTGVVRVSLGAMSIIDDIDKFIVFMAETFEENVPSFDNTFLPTLPAASSIMNGNFRKTCLSPTLSKDSNVPKFSVNIPPPSRSENAVNKLQDFSVKLPPSPPDLGRHLMIKHQKVDSHSSENTLTDNFMRRLSLKSKFSTNEKVSMEGEQDWREVAERTHILPTPQAEAKQPNKKNYTRRGLRKAKSLWLLRGKVRDEDRNV